MAAQVEHYRGRALRGIPGAYLAVALCGCGAPLQPRPFEPEGRSLLSDLEGVPESEWLDRFAGPHSTSADCRAIHVAALGTSGLPDARPLVEGFLDDPDIVVRRVAAEQCFGPRALGRALAVRYGYEAALAAERRARRIIGRLRRSDRTRQFHLTRRLIDLGRPAVCELQRQLVPGADEAVALSSAYALQEIRNYVPNVEPAWATDIRRKLRRKADFTFTGTPLPEAVATLSAASGVAMDVEDDIDEDARVDLVARGVSVEAALDRIMRAHELKPWFTDGRIIPCIDRMWNGSVLVFIDVRDLEGVGVTPDWLRSFGAEIAGASPRDGYSWIDDPGLGRNLTDSRVGLLEVMAPASGSDPDGEGALAPIRRYLDGLRRKAGLTLPPRSGGGGPNGT